ncbi:MAG: hypothetical protein ACM3ZC_12685 [Bacteroidota bacterium]
MGRYTIADKSVKYGKASAAILSAGVGSFLLGLFALFAEVSKAVKGFFEFYPPGGCLSGISTLAVLGWLFSWVILYFAWRNRDVRFDRVFIITVALIGLGLLFMFPPFAKVFKA